MVAVIIINMMIMMMMIKKIRFVHEDHLQPAFLILQLLVVVIEGVVEPSPP